MYRLFRVVEVKWLNVLYIVSPSPSSLGCKFPIFLWWFTLDRYPSKMARFGDIEEELPRPLTLGLVLRLKENILRSCALRIGIELVESCYLSGSLVECEGVEIVAFFSENLLFCSMKHGWGWCYDSNRWSLVWGQEYMLWCKVQSRRGVGNTYRRKEGNTLRKWKKQVLT